MAGRQYWVYILASQSRVLYVGVTNHNMTRRLAEHRSGQGGAFTRRYRTHALVYLEEHPRITDAIAREKTLKGWSRAKKAALVESTNPVWRDLAPA